MRGVDGVAPSEELTNHFEAETAIGSGNESDGHEVTLQGAVHGVGCSEDVLFLRWRVFGVVVGLEGSPLDERAEGHTDQTEVGVGR